MKDWLEKAKEKANELKDLTESAAKSAVGEVKNAASGLQSGNNSDSRMDDIEARLKVVEEKLGIDFDNSPTEKEPDASINEDIASEENSDETKKD